MIIGIFYFTLIDFYIKIQRELIIILFQNKTMILEITNKY